MTGNEAEIICGEWETGDASQSSTGELYNIILEIKEIVRHEDYAVNVETSAYLQNDIAVFKVDDTLFSKVRTFIHC